MKRLLSLLFLLPSLLATAQRLTIEPPTEVRAGVPFQLRYFVDADADAADFHLALPANLQLLSRTRASRFSSTTIINGHRTDERGTNLTLVVQAKQAGSVRVPAATLKLGGKTLTAPSFSIAVSDATSSTANRTTPTDMQRVGTRLTENDCFVTATADRTHVLEQQPVLITLRLYTRVGVAVTNPMLKGSLPEVQNAAILNVSPGASQMEVTQRGGVTYKSQIIGCFMFVPSASGNFTIPAMPITATAVQRQEIEDPFEAMLNSGAAHIGVPIERSTKPLSIQVDALPEPRPSDFSGGVGHMRLSANLKSGEVRANDVSTLRLTLSGTGNLKHLSPPAVAFPSDFETYAPKTADSTRLTRDGEQGDVFFDYTFVPRNPGRYVIPATTFSYFDTEAREYRTLRTDSIAIEVLPDNRTDAEREADAALRESDIAPLRLGAAKPFDEAHPSWWASWSYWLLLVLLIVIYFIATRMIGKHLSALADTQGLLRRRAGRVARRRLQRAEKLLSDPTAPAAAFYDEIAHALEGYLGEKYSLPTAERTRDNIRDILAGTKVPAEAAEKFSRALEQCDMARFAPSAALDKAALYRLAADAIEGLEVPAPRKPAVAPLVLFFLCSSLVPSVASTRADSLKTIGDSLYQVEHYAEAADAYESALAEAPSAALYQNLGNARYRMQDYTRAVIAYKRALRLEPWNADLRHNLQLCATKVEDRFERKQEMFFITWTRALRDSTSSDGWARWSIFFFLLFLCGAGLYRLSLRTSLRKTGFFGALLMLTLFLLCQAFAFSQRTRLRSEHRAVVVKSPAALRETSSPDAKTLRELHSGTSLTLADSTQEAFQVELPDGKTGWIKRSDVEEI